MQKKQIVFIEPFPIAMIYKISKLFKQKGYETVLIRILQANKKNDNFYEQAYNKVIEIDMPYISIYIKNFLKIGDIFLKKFGKISFSFSKILKLKPYVIFGRAPLSTPIAFFRVLFRKTPFIYFPYDIRSQAFPSFEIGKKYIPVFEIKADRWCFEHSDGILHKGDANELKYLNGRMLGDNIKLPKHEINIHPYCSSEFIVPFNKNKLSKKDKEIHMVYIGGTGGKTEKFYFEQLKSVEKIIKEGIHAHFYFGSEISNSDEIKKDMQIKKEFFIKFKNIPNIEYFHLEESFNSKDIAKEISKYDFGFWPRSDFNVRLNTGNKFSTFIEAGIPFFYFKKHRINDKIAIKYGLDVLRADNVESFKKKIESLDYDELIKSIKRAREDYLMEKHFPRLEKFVNCVVREKNGNKNGK